MNEFNKRVGQVLQQLRKQRGLTQEELAEATGIHDKYIGCLERGLYGITLEYLGKLARGLSVSVPDLVKSIYGIAKGENEREMLIHEIQTFLQSQPVEDLKVLRKFFLGTQRDVKALKKEKTTRKRR